MAESSSEEGNLDMGDEEGGKNWEMGLLRDSEAMSSIEDMGLDMDLTGNLQPINGAMEFGGNAEREENQAFSAMEAHMSFLDREAMEAMELQTSQAGGQSTAALAAQNLSNSIKNEEGQLSSGTGADSSFFFAAQDSPTMPRGMEEGRVPLWIKWRGRWQAGIQCSLEDCPAQTAKAMPTYGRKSYIVVFFPNSRSFVWTDWQLVCPISESPEPLALGSHESGRNSVADLNAARRYMLRKITTAMLDISDRLPVQAVVDCARDVSFWKDFAKEAAKAVTYQELGAMLMKLKSMILSTFLKEPFTLSCIDEWKHQCETVETAGSMEKLVKELKNAVCWDEVGKLWDELEQTNLDSGWKNWKEDVHCDNPNQSKPRYSSVSVTGHRRTFDARDCTPEGSDGHARSVDAGNIDSEQGYKRLKSEEQELMSNSAEPWEGTSTQQLGSGKNTNNSSLSAVIDYPQNSGLKLNNGAAVAQVENKTQTKSSRCLAFSDRKGRQCNKYASDGASYCCKHDPAGRTEEQKKGKLMVPNAGEDDSNAVICGGMTKYGRRCTHKARDGSAFCLKHMLQDSADPGKMITVENFASKPSLAPEFGGAGSNLGTPEQHGVSHRRKRKLEKASVGQPSSADSKVQEASKSASRMAARTANVTRCIGWCRGSSSQCSHRAKPGFSHCEKHLPGSLGYGRKGQEKAYSKGASSKISNGEDGRNISRLKDLIHEYMRARLADDGARNSQRPKSWQKISDWVLSEVAGNLKASESLYDLITAEMENLKKYFEEEDVMEVQKSLVPFLAGSVDHVSCSLTTPGGEKSIEHLSNVELLKQVSSTSTGHIPRFRCKLCAQEFVELIVLGQHWRGCHKKEAQQYFRGYTCQYCNLPFTNKKGLYRHRNAHHPGISSQTKSSLLALCIICSGQFMNFEDLWQHVIFSHPDHLCAFWPVTDPYAALGSSSDQWQPSGLEIVEAGKCSHCNQRFATYAELQQHREVVHGDHGHTSLVENPRKAFDTTDELKYKCKICGLKFRLLPDLGRHHQAEHKPVQAMRLKNVKEEAFITGPLEELNSIIGAEKEKKKLQKLDVRRAPGGQFKAEVITATQQNVGPEDPTIAEIEGYSGPKLEGCPSNKDILAVARSACCKNQLYSVLQKKYVALPDRLALKAAKLCSEANVRLQFYREGYVCPNGCKEVAFSSTDTKHTVETSFSNVSCFPLLPQFNQALLDYKAILESKDMVLDESHVVLTAFSGVGENHGNKTVLCEDLSFGKERVPIPCVVDRDAMGPCNCPMCVDGPSSHSETLTPWLHFCYVTKRTLDPSLGLDTESSRLGCSCQGHRCSPAKCEHVYLFDNDNTDAQDIYGRPMTGRFPYDSQGCIILEEGYLVYECNSICSCNEDCQNRVLQKGVQVKLEVYKTRHKGWAVRAAQRIPCGTFVCEYIGEVLDDCEANKRGERYDKEGCSYLYDIDAHIDIGRRGRPKPFVIDATKFGNVARFINHSCSPNLVNYQVLVESMDCQLAHIGLYATRDIDVGEELAYDYRYKLLPGKGCPCHCGARDCRGRLY